MVNTYTVGNMHQAEARVLVTSLSFPTGEGWAKRKHRERASHTQQAGIKLSVASLRAYDPPNDAQPRDPALPANADPIEGTPGQN